MRGFPLINGALILIALVVALIPLVRLTSAQRAELPTTVPTPTPSQGIPVTISARYAHPPTQLVISHLGQELWSAASRSEIDEGVNLALPLPEEGIDLLVTAAWPNGTPNTALEITLEPESLREQSKVLWGEGQAEDVLTFQWND
jgi:hypothetical protein